MRTEPESTSIQVRRLPGKISRGVLSLGNVRVSCALGRSGLTRMKREGDGATPVGRFRLISVFYRADRTRRPQTVLPVLPIDPADGWCDDPDDRNYNRPVRLPYPANHEAMRREDCLYDVAVVLDHNIDPRRRGAGSAIFFHIAKPGFPPTEGCVAIAPDAMRYVLGRIDSSAVMVIG